MLDKYVWGSVGRISPEAPVPVVEVENETERLGGAANVAHNIQSLGGIPVSIGVIGGDVNGKRIVEILESEHCSTAGLVVDETRPTTVKTRVIAHNQHVVRIDHEQKKEISDAVQEKIFSFVKNHIGSFDGMIIEDYNKGVVVAPLIRQIVKSAREHRTIITVDPKFNNFFEYKDVSVFKPNKKEVEEALGRKLTTEEEVVAAGKEILQRLNAGTVLLTRGENGMTLIEADSHVAHIPTQARTVADVSGAGDTVIATLTMALASAVPMLEAADLANHAAGVVCGEVGIVPIKPSALKSAILDDPYEKSTKR
ncbi:MAG: D-glycero-beta-D-manno-heptose-7-phosphate kinase [Bacteroidota bacterium]|nr:D-glycero-beta-D-manno-heptose-7-phosphate kinase [Bacteroidota bacterium]